MKKRVPRPIQLTTLIVVLCVTACLLPLSASAETVDAITSVSPSSATIGDSSVSVSITLDDSGTPPLPPSDVTPGSVTIGTIFGTSVSRSDNVVSATFDFSSASAGKYDVTVTFTTDSGELDIVETDGFTITPSGGSVSVVYVNAASTASSPDGTSWATAYTDIQDGIDLASLYDAEVWVAQGTYKPDTTSDRSVSIELASDVAVYGGFNGTESSRSERNYTTNTTILSGDIGTSGVDTDNSYHVVVGADGATLNGFTITKGYADGEKSKRMGGGMYNGGSYSADMSNDLVSPTIANCIFTGNYAESGGGMYNYAAAPTITSCTFSSNTANFGGGMLLRVGSDATITSCTFSSNSAEWRGGGVFIDYGADPTFSSCTFTSNSTEGVGGGVYIDDRASQLGGTYPTFSSCTFTSNSATYRGGAFAALNSSNYPTVSNCTFTSNTAGSAGGGAIALNQYVQLTLSGTITYSGNDGGTSDSSEDDIDYDSTCTVTIN